MNRALTRSLLSAALILAGLCPAAAQELQVSPSAEVLQGETQSVALSGVQPGQRVSLRLSRRAQLPGMGAARTA